MSGQVSEAGQQKRDRGRGAEQQRAAAEQQRPSSGVLLACALLAGALNGAEVYPYCPRADLVDPAPFARLQGMHAA